MKHKLKEILEDTLKEWECDVSTETIEQITDHLIENGVTICPVKQLLVADKFKRYFDELYGTGLNIEGWHENGELEPFDNFYESALEESEENE